MMTAGSMRGYADSGREGAAAAAAAGAGAAPFPSAEGGGGGGGGADLREKPPGVETMGPPLAAPKPVLLCHT